MSDTTVRPRSVVSILLIGILLGPCFAMLWIGRWQWAIVYLAVGVVAAVSISALEAFDYLPSVPAVLLYTSADLVSGGLQAVIGTTHVLKLRHNSFSRQWYGWIVLAPALLFLTASTQFVLFRSLVLDYAHNQSASNVPNLFPGDDFTISKSAYGYSQYSFPFKPIHFSGRLFEGQPQRGDMAVYQLPTDTDIRYINRVIGLPGDHIQMSGGILLINGAAATREDVTLPPDFAYRNDLSFYRETLPTGESYVIAEVSNDNSPDNTMELVVPPGHYFVLGDNRDESIDSRHFGYVPLDNFIGPVTGIIWNTNGVPIHGR